MSLTQILKLTLMSFFLLIIGCSDDTTGPGGENPPVVWTMGTEEVYSVTGSEPQTVLDYITGLDFHFPEGGEGDLVITEIISGPEAPYEGIGFSLDFTGDTPIEVLVQPYDDEEEISLLVYGSVPACYDDNLGTDDRWLIVPQADTVDGVIVYQLDPPTGSARNSSAKVAVRTFTYHWIARLTPTSTVIDTRQAMRWQSADFVTQFVDELDGTLKTKVDTEVKGRLKVQYEWDNWMYCGFWWRSLGPAGWWVKPTLHFGPNVSVNSVAHETGHYLVHAMVGDDIQSTLESQANLNGIHNITDDNHRAKVLEDYAYFLEYYFTNAAGGYTPDDPYTMWSGSHISPGNYDLPGLEGFGYLMLGGLTRPGTTVQSLFNPRVYLPVPELVLPFSKAFEIIAMGATDVNTLRANIQGSLTAEQNAKYQVIMQRSGWQYSINGVLVDKAGDPVEGVLVSNVLTAGGARYEGGLTYNPTDSQGKFTITGEVFPGESMLRCVKGSDTAYVPIEMDWDDPTNAKVDVGTLTVDFDNLLAQLQAKTHVSISVHGEHYSNYGQMGETAFSPTGLWPLSWNGTNFSAVDTTRGSSYTSERRIDGTVSANGRNLVSVTYTYKWREANNPPRNGVVRVESDVTITITNLDFYGDYYNSLRFYLTGPETQSHAHLEYKRLVEYEDEELGTEVTEYDHTAWNSTTKTPNADVYFSW